MTDAAEADAIRRRYAVVFNERIEDLRDYPVAPLRRALTRYDAQKEMYLSMGFEIDDPEATARDDAAR